MHSLTRNFDDHDYVDKRGTKEVARFDPDFFDDVVKTFSLKTLFCGFCFHIKRIGKTEFPQSFTLMALIFFFMQNYHEGLLLKEVTQRQ